MTPPLDDICHGTARGNLGTGPAPRPARTAEIDAGIPRDRAGVTVGVLTRRSLPAMAIVLACVAVVQPGWPTVVRPHLIPPATSTGTVSVNVSTARVGHEGELAVPVTDMPGAWIISNQTITPSGRVFVLPDVAACSTGTQQQCNRFLATQHLRRRITYQPASRFWAFQAYETAIFVVLSLALAGFSVWWIRSRRLAR